LESRIMLHVLYLVHDLTDAAVKRRVAMLVAGGARVTVAGFRREDRDLRMFDDGDEEIVPVDLGVTRDGQFARRVVAVGCAAWGLRSRLAGLSRPDIVIARNLEMLALARRAAALFDGSLPIVYECLDIHRLMLAAAPAGPVMRAAERRFAENAQLLVTSSPAFLRHYFEPFRQIGAPALLLENKVLETRSPRAGKRGPDRRRAPHPGEPWRIGWFGALRCAKSLDILSDFTRRMGGGVIVMLRGRPAEREIPDFETRIADEPYLEFGGAYRNPDDLAEIYADVHFNWAIDFFEEGMNSEWLLPNRLYEGGVHGVVPIARAATETGRFLNERGVGIVLDDCTPQALVSLFETMDAEAIARERAWLDAVGRRTWVHDEDDCRDFVLRLAELAGSDDALRSLREAA
jgi:succinoglycan biosynthesis protein ExoL